MKNLLYIITALLVCSFVSAQTTSENYVKNTVYKKEVKTQADILLLEEEHKLETVTYLDGLGRTIQSISKQVGGNREDLITSMVYDNFGRQLKDYLPYARTISSLDLEASLFPNANGDIPLINTFYANKFVDDQITSTMVNAYSEKYIENSPLGRVLEQGAPGKDWFLNANTSNNNSIKFEYSFNTYDSNNASNPNNDNVVMYRVSSTENLVNNGYYLLNTLTKSIVKDENWQPVSGKNHTTEEFKNLQGQVILKRTYNDGISHDTQYVS